MAAVVGDLFDRSVAYSNRMVHAVSAGPPAHTIAVVAGVDQCAKFENVYLNHLLIKVTSGG